MMNNYIEKVLSHIKGNKRRNEISIELFDHMDECEKFFKQIGYGEQIAYEKAEEKMGDADVLGEQFQARAKLEIIKLIFSYAIMVIALLGLFLFYHNCNISGSFSSTELPEFILPNFWGTVVNKLGIAFAMVIMFFGLNKKRIIHSTYGYLLAIALVLIGPHNLFYCFDKDYVMSFYANPWTCNTGLYIIDKMPYQILLLVSICLILTLFYGFGINNVIKSKRLTNSRNDMKLGKIGVIGSMVIAFLCVVFTVGVSVAVYQAKDSALEKAKTEITAANEFIRDNAVTLAYGSFEENDRLISQRFPDYYRDGDEGFARYTSTSDFMTIDLCTYDGYTEVCTICNIVNPFLAEHNYLLLDEEEILSSDFKSFSNDMTIYDAPVLCSLTLNTSDAITLSFNYDNDKYINFMYYENDKSFKFSDASLIDFTKNADLTIE